MTTIESMMLAVCFGAVMGTFIGNTIWIIKDMLDNRKRKKKNKEQEESQ